MARIVNSSLLGSPAAELNAAERRKAARKLARSRARNPLRRVRLRCCHRWVLDSDAVVGDWLWCEQDGDLARVIEIAE